MKVDEENPLEQANDKLLGSITSGKYATQDDIILTERATFTNKWKYVNCGEFGNNGPFQTSEITVEKGPANLFAIVIHEINDEKAPPNKCHSIKFWLAAASVVFDSDHADYSSDTSQDL